MWTRISRKGELPGSRRLRAGRPNPRPRRSRARREPAHSQVGVASHPEVGAVDLSMVHCSLRCQQTLIAPQCSRVQMTKVAEPDYACHGMGTLARATKVPCGPLSRHLAICIGIEEPGTRRRMRAKQAQHRKGPLVAEPPYRMSSTREFPPAAGSPGKRCFHDSRRVVGTAVDHNPDRAVQSRWESIKSGLDALDTRFNVAGLVASRDDYTDCVDHVRRSACRRNSASACQTSTFQPARPSNCAWALSASRGAS